MTLRVKGLPLTRTPAYVDENGFSVFHLSDKVDIVETLNAARTQVFPDVRIPVVDKVFDQIMAARAAVAAKCASPRVNMTPNRGN